MPTAGFRVQKEWRRDRPPAIFFGTLGAALFIVGLFADNPIAMLLGWVFVVLVKLSVIYYFTPNKSHIKYVATRMRTSWVSRGVLAISIFAIFGGLYILGTPLFRVPYPAAVDILLAAIALAAAALVMLYDGFVQSVNKAITLWANAATPIFFVTTAIYGAVQVVLALDIGLFAYAWQYVDIFLLLSTLSLATQLWSAANLDVAGQESVSRLLSGEGRGSFWTGVILGYVLPAIIFNISLLTPSVALIAASAATAAVGYYLIIYSIIRLGIYRPMFYPWSHPSKV